MSSALPNVARSAVFCPVREIKMNGGCLHTSICPDSQSVLSKNLHSSSMRPSFSELKVELSVSLLLGWKFCHVFPGPTSYGTFWDLGPESVKVGNKRKESHFFIKN